MNENEPQKLAAARTRIEAADQAFQHANEVLMLAKAKALGGFTVVL
jgi:hypothetical protein